MAVSARIVGVALAAGLGLGGAVTAVVLAGGSGAPVNELAIVLAVGAYLAVGLVISIALPGHLVGRLLLFGGSAWGIGEGLLAVAVELWSRQQAAAAGWFAVLGSVRGLGWLAVVLGVPLVFPDGRTAWGGRRPLVLAAVATGAFAVASVIAPTPLDYRLQGVDSPTGVPEPLKPAADLLALSALGAVAVALVVAIAGLVHRWRIGDKLLRQQLGTYLAAFAAPLVLLPFVPTTLVEPWMFVLVSLPVPVAVGVAMFQRRLYDVQLVVHRTVTFVALSVAVAGLYAAVVGGVGALLQDRGAAWLPWVAAGVIAVAFAPLRNALQLGVSRMVYGQWLQPADVLAATGRRLADSANVPVLLQTLADEVAGGLRLSCVQIVDGHGQTLALHGQVAAAEDELPLTAYGQIVGVLRWGPARLRASHRQLLEHLAGQLGGIVHSARLVENLQEAQERLVLAREDERRRLRRELHDGLGPTLAALTLQVDTVRNVLAAGREAEADLLALRSGVASTVLDVRRMVEGLRPPALDELGLPGALAQLAERVTRGTELTVEVTLPDTLPEIPAAVEVAAYRVTQEALTNAVRHARATRSEVALRVDGDGLRLEIHDNGTGQVRPRPGGIGLTTMHERAAEIGGRLSISAAAQGTTVALWLPRPAGAVP